MSVAKDPLIKVLYTHQKTKKWKTWQDGFIKVASDKKVLLLDEAKAVISSFSCPSSKLVAGEEIETARYLITVDEVECDQPPLAKKPCPPRSRGPALSRPKQSYATPARVEPAVVPDARPEPDPLAARPGKQRSVPRQLLAASKSQQSGDVLPPPPVVNSRAQSVRAEADFDPRPSRPNKGKLLPHQRVSLDSLGEPIQAEPIEGTSVASQRRSRDDVPPGFNGDANPYGDDNRGSISSAHGRAHHSEHDDVMSHDDDVMSERPDHKENVMDRSQGVGHLSDHDCYPSGSAATLSRPGPYPTAPSPTKSNPPINRSASDIIALIRRASQQQATTTTSSATSVVTGP